MAPWPFGRRKRKGGRSQMRAEEDEDQDLGISTLITGPEDAKQLKVRENRSRSRAASRQVSKNRQPDLASPLSAHPSRPVPREMSSVTSIEKVELPQESPPPPLPRQPLAEVSNRSEMRPLPVPTDHRPDLTSKISLATVKLPESITPTLNHKRSRGPQDPSRQKSGKRRAEEKDRLEKIRSMSMPIPTPGLRGIQPVAGPTAQDSRQHRHSSNQNLTRPLSQISSRPAASIRSSFSGPLEMSNNWRVSPFDALSPRPTIRYANTFQEGPESLVPTRTATKKEKSAVILEEGDFSPRARIEDLAEDLDARALRQVMEREDRRKERKAKAKQERAERRKREGASRKERPLETTKANNGDLQITDAEAAGPSGVSRTPQIASSSPDPKQHDAPPPEAHQTPYPWANNPSKESLKQDEPSLLETIDNDEKEEPVVEIAQAVHISTANVSANNATSTRYASGPSDVSLPSVTTDPPMPPPRSVARELARSSVDEKAEKSSLGTGSPSRWKTIFRRSGTRNRDSFEKTFDTPSEFSNTSRESFVRRQKIAPAPLPLSIPPRRTNANADADANANAIPRRTKSKFREDLPEYTVSPPSSRHSRVAGLDSPVSPASPVSPYIDDTAKMDALNDEDRVTTPLGHVHPALRGEMTLSRGQSQRSASPEVPPAATLSESLASVDSEGSWLTGRPPKRASIPVATLREGGGSISEHAAEISDETSSKPDAAYFARREPVDRSAMQTSGLTAQIARGYKGPVSEEISADTPLTSQVPAEGNLREGRIPGHRPMVVHAAASHLSREGLLLADDLDEERPSPLSEGATTPGAHEDVSPVEPNDVNRRPSSERQDSGLDVGLEEMSVQQATTVALHRGPSHTRRVSAGSARILDIPARGANAEKRNSALSFGSSQPSPAIPNRTFESAQANEKEERKEVEDSAAPATMGIRSTTGPSASQGLGLSLRLGAHPAAGLSAVSDPDSSKPPVNDNQRTSLDE